AVDASATTVAGSLDGAPGTAYTVQFFASEAPAPAGRAEGGALLGSAAVATDAAGHSDFRIALPAVPAGRLLTATATGPGGTSGFSAALPAAAAAGPHLATSVAGPSATARVG